MPRPMSPPPCSTVPLKRVGHRLWRFPAVVLVMGCTSGPTKEPVDAQHAHVPVDSGLPPIDLSEPILDDPDSNLVLLLPATDAANLAEQWTALLPWIESRVERGYAPLAVPAYAISVDGPTPEEIHQHLGQVLSPAPASDGEPARQLMVFSLHQDSSDRSDATVILPRAELTIVGLPDLVRTDAPYGDPWANIELVAGAESQFGDFALEAAPFVVSRVPADSAEELARFAEQSIAYEQSPWARDTLLAAGTITSVTGDTSVLLCGVANRLQSEGLSPHVRKVFDLDTCDPDMVPNASDHNLGTFLADDPEWEGGIIYNISHGSGESVFYYNAEEGYHKYNLDLSDVPELDPSRLNVFISLSCALDEPLVDTLNLNRQLLAHGSVATVTATATVYFAPGTEDVIEMEVEALPMVLDPTSPSLGDGFRAARGEYLHRASSHSALDQPYAWSNGLSLQISGDGTLAF